MSSNPFSLPKNPNASKEAALKAARERATSSAAKADAIQKWCDPEKAPERISLIFDDSGSMSSEYKNAIEGVIEFFRNCIPNQTAIELHMLTSSHPELEKWQSNLIKAAEYLKAAEGGFGGTPLFEYLKTPFLHTVKPTRIVAFTDGQPTDHIVGGAYGESLSQLERWKRDADEICKLAADPKVPIDTVFFGSASYNEDEIAFLRYLSEKSGGYFLHFDPAKVNFRTAFKYLAGTNRLMLASESVRKEIESGKRS